MNAILVGSKQARRWSWIGTVSKFVRKNGNVTVLASRGAKMTLLKNGEIVSVAFVEKDATKFKDAGKWYTRKEFEKLARSYEELE